MPENFSSLFARLSGSLVDWSDWLPGDKSRAECGWPENVVDESVRELDTPRLRVISALSVAGYSGLVTEIELRLRIAVSRAEDFVNACSDAKPLTGFRYWQEIPLDEIVGTLGDAPIRGLARTQANLLRAARSFFSALADVDNLMQEADHAILQKTGSLAASSTSLATCLGNGRIEVDGKLIRLCESQAYVLEVLVELRATTLTELRQKSGYDSPNAILKTIQKRHPDLARHIRLPGGKGMGGYTTSIVDGRTKKQTTTK